ncbi:hypothetical protein BU23DRAFT_553031 [Bimuria novae-zelandiae CBS 107.79]|uniref:Uncharacterized protein n=1 Tax=Bimuria novae-zelandiae CBS 107.79 TaxID=1447943 RepID=A0A6A5VDI4_9PLEO|nr:hypothetical protein BU23DRAFT_553031 [Bimuria novae-zelandiae CBS 107.79]
MMRAHDLRYGTAARMLSRLLDRHAIRHMSTSPNPARACAAHPRFTSSVAARLGTDAAARKMMGLVARGYVLRVPSSDGHPSNRKVDRGLYTMDA